MGCRARVGDGDAVRAAMAVGELALVGHGVSRGARGIFWCGEAGAGDGWRAMPVRSSCAAPDRVAG